jgi:hypothetical protein
MVQNPHVRLEGLRPVLERLGEKLEGSWLAFGEYVAVLICQMPDYASAAALAIAFPEIAGPELACSKVHESGCRRTPSLGAIRASSCGISLGDQPIYTSMTSRSCTTPAPTQGLGSPLVSGIGQDLTSKPRILSLIKILTPCYRIVL